MEMGLVGGVEKTCVSGERREAARAGMAELEGRLFVVLAQNGPVLYRVDESPSNHAVVRNPALSSIFPLLLLFSPAIPFAAT